MRVAGILFQAGERNTDALLKWGSDSKYAGNVEKPGVASDIFARVGGPNDPTIDTVRADAMMVVNSGNVVIDNTWLWRADHDTTGDVKNYNNPVTNGLVVNGDNVFAYGLKAEHTLGDLVQWNGENGMTVMYQSELPYDVDQDYGDAGFAGYRVAESIQNHTGYGIGVYSFYRDHDVVTPSGIVTPSGDGISFTNSFSVYLWG